MKIERVNLTEANMMEVVRDDSVYVIYEPSYDKGHYRMDQINECEIKLILSDRVAIVKITNGESI